MNNDRHKIKITRLLRFTFRFNNWNEFFHYISFEDRKVLKFTFHESNSHRSNDTNNHLNRMHQIEILRSVVFDASQSIIHRTSCPMMMSTTSLSPRRPVFIERIILEWITLSICDFQSKMTYSIDEISIGKRISGLNDEGNRN